MAELLEQLRPLIGELLSVLITLLIAWLKKRGDKKNIKKAITTLLRNKNFSSDTIEEVLAKVDNFDKNARA